MHEVMEVDFGVVCKTRVWFSQSVHKDVAKFRRKGDPKGAFWMRLERAARNGFELYERGDPPMVVNEGNGVFRFGTRDSLFRLIGFYEADRKDNFIVPDCFTKP